MKKPKELDGPVVKWKVPKKAAQADTKQGLLESLRFLPKLAFVFVIFLGVVTLYYHWVLPGKPVPYRKLCGFLVAGLPHMITSLAHTFFATKETAITHSGFSTTPWEWLDTWRIIDDKRFPDLRRAEVRYSRSRKWLGESFDPSEVSEQDIRSALQHYLPGRENIYSEIEERLCRVK